MITLSKPATKERPIIFSGPSVKAILEGRKTQTRRIITPQPRDDWAPVVGLYHPTKVDRHGEEYPGDEVFGASDEEEGRVCRYGGPGDRLWVREIWTPHYTGWEFPPHYRADLPDDPDAALTANHAFGLMKWRQAMFMPRWASRITLDVVDIRPERLQDISEADAISEGFYAGTPDMPRGTLVRSDFEIAWDHINGKRAPWSSNPWVFVISFKRIDQ